MVPLHKDPFFTFRFAEDRLIPRFHLEGVASSRRVQVYAANPKTLEPIRLLATALVREEGWVDLAEALIVRAGEVFVVIPTDDGQRK
ncbi:MAG: hypothetical protein K2R98_29060 [Gemmataceae bacterium]|nr:hypothetical protein [Gemmataceae bacterium]